MSKQTIELDLSEFFQAETIRKTRKANIVKLANPQTDKGLIIAAIISDIINDAADGYALKNGMTDIMITDAVKHIIKIVEEN